MMYMTVHQMELSIYRRRRRRTLPPKIFLFLIFIMYSPVVIFKHKLGLLNFHESDNSTFFVTNNASGEVVETECEN